MATPNYGYEKRQKELAKKRKKEDKLKEKSERKTQIPGDAPQTQRPDQEPAPAS
ncbi:MAG: hypothetical protein K9K38_11335 [Rhodoferax sp.]|nr:hypothetical protein [Rhodoferax sp.]